MNKILSQIIADLFVKSKGDEELSSKINELRSEIRKVVESEDAIFGKFCGLLESLGEIIPDERQRYHAAIKALSTTSKLSKQEIVNAVNKQLEELKILEKGLMPALPGWRDELKVMEARLKEMRDEISRLREKIAQLVGQEQEILKSMAAQEKEVDLVEKAVKELFTDLAAEITSVRKKIEEFSSESAAPTPASAASAPPASFPTVAQQIPLKDSLISDIPVAEERDVEPSSDIEEPSTTQEQQDTEWQKKCPMCGGRMNFHDNEQLWLCYSCAYEESTKDEDPGKSKEKGGQTNTPKPLPASETISDLSPSFDDPFETQSSNEQRRSKKKSSSSDDESSAKTKTCPVCRKKMNWHQTDRAWRCPFCDYERSI